MYVLKWSIDAWLYKMCMSIYSFAADIYTLILQVAGAKIMDNATVSTYVGNIGILVGVFMLFKVAISLLTYLVDPDQTDDKRTGSTSLISGIVVTMALLIAYPFAFKALRVVQDAVLNSKDGNNILVQLFSGSSRKEPGAHINGINCYYSNGAHPNVGGTSYDAVISLVTNNSKKEFTWIDYDSGNWFIGWNYHVVNGITVDRNASYVFKYDDYKEQNNKIRVSWWYSDRISYNKGGDAITINEIEGEKSVLNHCPKYFYYYDNGFRILLSDEKLSLRSGEREATYNPEKTKERAYVNDAGRIMAGSLLFSFISCDSSVDSDTCEKLGKSMSINDIEGTYDYVADGSDLNDAVEFQSFLALLFGIVLILFLVTTTADVAVRTVKLMVLEIFAPIPIVSYCDPKSRSVFESWLKTLGVVYADIFIRIIIIAVCNFLISSISIAGYSGFVRIALIIGILLFLKEAPQFICNMFGIKSQGLGNFTLNPMQKLKETPIIGGAMGAAAGAISGAASGAKKGGFGGALLGGFAGGHAGFKNSGGLMGQQAGKPPQNSSGRVGSTAGEAFMTGKGGFMSQQVGARAARAYIGNEKYADDEKTARANLATASQTRSDRQSDLDDAKVAYAAAKSQYDRNPTSTAASANYFTASRNLINAQTAYNAARQGEENAQAALTEAQRVRGKAKAVVDDAPNTARQVRHK